MNRISHVITCCLGIIIKIKHMNMIITPFFLQHNYMQKLFNSSLLEELDTMNVIHILRMNFPKNNQVPSSFNNENNSPNHLAQETSSKISIGRLLESTRHLVELLYWMSTRTEDLADCFITFSSPLCHAKYKNTGDVYP